MSWDMIAFVVPPEIKVVADFPPGYEPRPIGSREEVLAKIRGLFPSAEFQETATGFIFGEDHSVEVYLHKDDPVKYLSLSLHGGEAGMAIAVAIVNHFGLRAIDCQETKFLDRGTEAQKSFRTWSAYRDRVVAEYKDQPQKEGDHEDGGIQER
jgi:hypothetical protein